MLKVIVIPSLSMPRVQATYRVSSFSAGGLLKSLPSSGSVSIRPGSRDSSQKNPNTLHRNPNLTGSVQPSYTFRNSSASLAANQR